MSSEIDQRIVEMKFENGQFENGVKNSISTLEKLKSALKFDTRADGFENIQKSADSLNFSKVEEALDSVINRYSTLGIIGARVIENLVDKAMTGIDTVIGKIQSGGMSRALNLEQAKFQLKGLDVDWDESLQTGIAKNVNDAVTDTAFGLDAAAKAASQLVASNVEVGESMDHALKAISGVAAMTNSTYDDIANVFTRIAGNGKVMSQDLMSFSSRGLNAAAELGRVLNYTEAEIRDMVHEGEINFEIFSEAMYKSFAEHAKKANETFSGAMSNTNAALSRIGERFATPYIQNMRPVLVELIGFLKAINKSIDPLVNSVSGVMSKISTIVVDKLHAITGQLVDINDESRPLLTGASNWMLKISTALKEIIDGLGGMVSMFTDFWSTAFNVPDSNPLVDFANGLYEAASVFKYAFTGIANEDSAAVKEFIAIFGDSSGIFEDFKAAVTSVANVINILYSKLRLIWQKIVQPLAMRVLPAILKYIRSMAEEIETIVKLLLDNKIVDTAISGIGKGLTTVADLIFSIGGKAEDSAKQVQKAAEDTANAVVDSAKLINKKQDEIFSSRESIIAKYFDTIREAAGGAWGSEEGDIEAFARRLGLSWDEIDKFKEVVEEYRKVGESLFDGVDFSDGAMLGGTIEERLDYFNSIYSKNAQLIDKLKQEAIESVQSTFKHVSFDERSVGYMGDTFFNRLYDKLMENGFGEKDALAIVHKFREDFVTEYEAQSEEDMKAWQEVAKEEATKHEELRAEFASDYSKDRESMMGWTSSSVYSDMEKANKAFDKAWDKINSKNKGKSFDQLDYSQMFNDFYEESYKALIDMGMSEEEAIRRSLINKQTYINKWAEMDEETFLLMEANAEEYVKTLDEMTPIEQIGFTLRSIFDTIMGVGRKAYENVIKPIGQFIGGLATKAWKSISDSAKNIWEWVTKTWGIFKNSKAFQTVSKTFKDIKNNVESIGGSLSTFFEPLLELIPEIKIPEFDPELAERFATAIGNIATFISGGLSEATKKILEFKEAVKKHLVFDTNTGQLDIIGTLKKNLEDLTGFVSEKAGIVTNFFKGLFELDDEGHLKKIQELKEAIRGFFTNEQTGEIDIFGTLLKKAGEALEPITSKVKEVGEAIRKTFINEDTQEIDVLGGLKKLALDAFQQIVDKIEEVKKKIKAFFGIVDEEEPVEVVFKEVGDVDTSKIEKVVKDIPWLDSAVQSFNQTIQGIPSAVSTMMDDLGITNVIEAIGSAIETAQKKVEDFIKFVQGIPASIASTFTQLFGNPLEKLSPITEALTPVGETIKGLIPKEIPKDGIIGAIFGGFGTAFDTVMETAQKFGDYILGLPASITAAFENFSLEDTLNNAFKFLLNFPEKLKSIFGPDNIKKIFDSLFTNDNRNNPEVLKGWVAQDVAPFITLTEGIKEKAGEIRDAIAGIFSDDEGNFDIFAGLRKAFEGFIEFLQSIPGRIAEALSGTESSDFSERISGLREAVGGLFTLNDETGNLGIFDAIIQALSNFVEFLKETFPFVKDVIDWITGTDIGSDTAEKLNEISDTVTVITDTSKNFVESMEEEDGLLTKIFDLLTFTHVAWGDELSDTVDGLGEAADTVEDSTEKIEKKKSIFQDIGDIIGEFIGLISTVFDRITEAIPNILRSANNIIQKLPDVTPVVESAFTVITDFAGGIMAALKGVFDAVHNNWPEIQGFLGSIGGTVLEVGSEGAKKIGDFFNEWFSGLFDAEKSSNGEDPGLLTKFFEVLKTGFAKLGEVADVVIENHDKIFKAAQSLAIASFIWNIGQTVKAYRANLGGGYIARGFQSFSSTINSIGSQILQAGIGVSLIVGSAEYINQDNNEQVRQTLEDIGALLTIIAAADIAKSVTAFLGKIVDWQAGNPLRTVFFNLSNVGTMIAAIGLGLLEIALAVRVYNNFTAGELFAGLLKVSMALAAISLGLGLISGLQGLASKITGGAASLVGVPAAIVALGAGLLEVIGAIAWINSIVDKEKAENDGSLGESLLIVTGAIAALAAGSFAIGASGASTAILATAGAIAALGGAFILLGVGLDVLSGTDFAEAIGNVFDALREALLGDVNIIDSEADVQERVGKGKETVNKIFGDYVDGINQGISEIETENAGLDGLEGKMGELEDGLNDALSAAETLDAKINNGTNDEFERTASLINDILSNQEADLETKIALIQQLKKDLEESLTLRNISNYKRTDYASLFREGQPIYDNIVTMEPEAPPLATAPSIDSSVYEATAQEGADVFNSTLYSAIANADPSQYGVDNSWFTSLTGLSADGALDSFVNEIEDMFGVELPEEIKSGLTGIGGYFEGEVQNLINAYAPTGWTGTVDMSSYESQLTDEYIRAYEQSTANYKDYINNSDLPDEYKAQALECLNQYATGITSTQPEIQSAMDGTTQVVFNELGAIPTEANAKGLTTNSELAAGISSTQSDVQSAMDGTTQVVFNELDTMPTEANAKGLNTTSELAVGISANQSEAETAMQNVGIATHTKLDEIQPQYAESGRMAVLGFASGMALHTYVAENAARAMAQAAINAANKTLDNRSPSHVLEESGAYGALGFVKGILDNIPTVENASEQMASSFLDGLSTASDLASQVLSDDFQLDPTIQPIIDSSQIQNGVNEINGLFGQRSLDLATNASVEFTNQQQQMYESMQYPDPINYNEKFDTLSGRIDALQQAIINSPITLDSGILVGALRPQMDSALGSMSMRRNRGL